MAEHLLKLPDLGEDAGKEATVNLWHKKPGDRVARDEDVLEVTYDKATFFVPSPVDGTLKSIVAAEDAVIQVGGTLAIIESDE
jgi:2-oxoglutarate dehydrogenase E2 component (dihydrolipoamide succinyltransferase)